MKFFLENRYRDVSYEVCQCSNDGLLLHLTVAHQGPNVSQEE